MTLNPSLDFGDLLQAIAMVGAVGAACWKAARWQATLEQEVLDGFRRNDERHLELKNELVRHGELLVEHGEHLASLDERSAMLLRQRPEAM